ncbi:MAG: bifunctional DNA-formamidopyrimidine glycosylase/DNA-(apurinic or apyrimidinic site) lyase [Ilumatobacteraceae bacterium]
MPELPEVETVRRALAVEAIGRRVDAVEVGRDRVARRTSPDAIVAGLTGAEIERVDRRGKYLLVGLDTGSTVMIHLRMSGQLLIGATETMRPRHCHVMATLDDGRELRFVDPRTFGEVVVCAPGALHRLVPELSRLGPDPIVDGVDARDLSTWFRGRRRRLKSMLLDQSIIAGIGNIYGDEICHRARLRPDRPVDSIDRRGCARLASAVSTVLDEAIAAGGSTLRDAQYVGLDGVAGSYQREHRVHARAGERCRTCGRGIVRRMSLDQRGTHWCPVCQR